MHEIKDTQERVILVAVNTGKVEEAEESLDELEELVDTAGAEVVGRIIQNLDAIQSVTYIGKGKLEEVKELIIEKNATGIVCDDELSPMQIRNLEDALETKIMDRTLVILDIFASHAVTKEGKVQVELAQLRYQSTRLAGLGKSLSRLGGGIGTRGPGEKKIEVDRRIIKDRIAQLRSEVASLEKHRELARTKRKKEMTPIAAIVGYTNAGKSTLLNTLTEANILEEDKLFATLDPTTRKLKLPSGQEILLTDTVGFIRKLPHHLIDAFRSTLEEAKYADILIHVVDISNPQYEAHMKSVYDTLEQLGANNKKVITLFNKIDKIDGELIVKDTRAEQTIQTAIKKKIGIEELTMVLEKILKEQKVFLKKLFSYQEAGKISSIRKYGQLLREEYQADGIYVEAYIPKELEGQIKNG